MKTNPIRYWHPRYNNWRIGWITTRGPKWVHIKTITARGNGRCKLPASEHWMIQYPQ